MDPILWVIVVLGGGLLVATIYMEYLGVSSVMTRKSSTRCQQCGAIRAAPHTAEDETCWSCRHRRLRHPIHAVETGRAHPPV